MPTDIPSGPMAHRAAAGDWSSSAPTVTATIGASRSSLVNTPLVSAPRGRPLSHSSGRPRGPDPVGWGAKPPQDAQAADEQGCEHALGAHAPDPPSSGVIERFASTVVRVAVHTLDRVAQEVVAGLPFESPVGRCLWRNLAIGPCGEGVPGTRGTALDLAPELTGDSGTWWRLTFGKKAFGSPNRGPGGRRAVCGCPDRGVDNRLDRLGAPSLELCRFRFGSFVRGLSKDCSTLGVWSIFQAHFPRIDPDFPHTCDRNQGNNSQVIGPR